ncbi:SCO4225 family membrane protein [Streptomyces griseoruber]|uniref:SCO4225 family membrane protein n=1 Tax=Streptomyces griseoruber TaxID=1943 RepID=UPI0037BD4A09
MSWTWECVPDEATVAAGAPPAFLAEVEKRVDELVRAAEALHLHGPSYQDADEGAKHAFVDGGFFIMNGYRSLVSALRTPAALGYLFLVGALAAWVAVDTLFISHADASFAGMWLFFATAPTSLLFLVVPSQFALIGVSIGAVVQAALLGAAYQGLTRTRPVTAG